MQWIVTKEEDWWKFFEACSIEPFKVVYEELANGIESTNCDVLIGGQIYKLMRYAGMGRALSCSQASAAVSFTSMKST